MVKQLDDRRIEHVGVDLWRAALAFRERLHGEMVKRGHDWYADARVGVAEHLAPEGMSQAELVTRMGITKQAVQQLLDRLEADGIIRRVADPSDKRGKRIEYTANGLRAVSDGNAVKRRLEKDLRDRLGAKGFDDLRARLAEVADVYRSAK